MVHYDGVLYYFGGSKTEDNKYPSLSDKHLYRYDLATQKWSYDPADATKNRFGFALMEYRGVLYIFQGYNDEEVNLRTVLKLDVKANSHTWLEVPLAEVDLEADYLPFDSYSCIGAGSRMYFVCGWGSNALKNDISYVDLALGEPLEFVTLASAFTAPAARKHHQLVNV
jgi:hypothetical protein